MTRPVEWYEEHISGHTGPEPRSRFLAIYLIALVAVGFGLIWWGW